MNRARKRCGVRFAVRWNVKHGFLTKKSFLGESPFPRPKSPQGNRTDENRARLFSSAFPATWRTNVQKNVTNQWKEKREPCDGDWLVACMSTL